MKYKKAFTQKILIPSWAMMNVVKKGKSFS